MGKTNKTKQINKSLHKSSPLLEAAFVVAMLIKIRYAKFKFFLKNLTSLKYYTKIKIYFNSLSNRIL